MMRNVADRGAGSRETGKKRQGVLEQMDGQWQGYQEHYGKETVQ